MTGGNAKSFGQSIRELRKAKLPPLSQRELAKRVENRLRDGGYRGFDFTYLSKIENDHLPPPSTAAIIALAHELDANPDELLALAAKPPPDVGQVMKRSKAARLFFRLAVNESLSEAEWEKLLESIKRIKDERGKGI